jgi:hypothetical protein
MSRELREEVDRMAKLFHDLVVEKKNQDIIPVVAPGTEFQPLPQHFGPLTPPLSMSKPQILPIHTHFSQIMSSVFKNTITILVAETGAGKSTQMPRFILEYWKEHLKSTKYPVPRVFITQPRRIAATSVARRVADEQGTKVGIDSAIGYSVRFESKHPKNQRDGTASMSSTSYLAK